MGSTLAQLAGTSAQCPGFANSSQGGPVRLAAAAFAGTGCGVEACHDLRPSLGCRNSGSSNFGLKIREENMKR